MTAVLGPYRIQWGRRPSRLYAAVGLLCATSPVRLGVLRGRGCDSKFPVSTMKPAARARYARRAAAAAAYACTSPYASYPHRAFAPAPL
eukprot:SAG31_NODE_1651_length_7634_cov_5.579562_5_plen_89_part_00